MISAWPEVRTYDPLTYVSVMIAGIAFCRRVAAGKAGGMFVLNRDGMGGLNAGAL
jgi:hypothetical protein